MGRVLAFAERVMSGTGGAPVPITSFWHLREGSVSQEQGPGSRVPWAGSRGLAGVAEAAKTPLCEPDAQCSPSTRSQMRGGRGSQRLSSHFECIRVRAAWLVGAAPTPGSPRRPRSLHSILRLLDTLCVPGWEPLCWLPPGPENAPLQTPHGFCSAVPSQTAPARPRAGTVLVRALPLPAVLLSV